MSTWKRIEPATAAKLAANRENAQQSTGPRTLEGKARSSQNARTHGLSARELVIRPGERAEFDQFEADFVAEYQPDGILEMTLLNQIVAAAWNLRRVRILEAELFTGTTDPLLDEQNEAKLDRLSRYAQRFERSFHRAIKELRVVQTSRAQRASVLPAVRATIPPRADTAQAVLAKRTHPAIARERDMNILLASVEREPDVLLSRARACAP